MRKKLFFAVYFVISACATQVGPREISFPSCKERPLALPPLERNVTVVIKDGELDKQQTNFGGRKLLVEYLRHAVKPLP